MSGKAKFSTPTEMQGCGKLSHTVVSRLIKNNLSGNNGVTLNGASKYEIFSVIYLSQIADSSGFVSQFRIQDLANVTGCSIRNTYNILHNLKSKGFISFKYYNNVNWSGIKDIRLLNNDFSKVTKYSGQNRYVNSFHTCFDFTDKKSYAFLHSLSLYALRTLLIILDIYKYENGTRISCLEIANRLGISHVFLTVSYMQELEKFYGTGFFTFKKNHSRRKGIYGYITIAPRNPYLNAPKSPADMQMTYFKRKWLLFFQNNDIEYSALTSNWNNPLSCLNRLFSLIFSTLCDNANITYTQLEQRLTQYFLNYFHWDVVTVHRAVRYAAQSSPPDCATE